jgi:uncharacterized protein YndB with AHSA1/START domain
MDVRPGGAWQLVLHGPDGTDYKNRSVFVEVKEPERLVFDHVSGPHFTMTATFAEDGAKTRVTMRMVFPSAAEYEQAVKGFGAVEGAEQTLIRLGDSLRALTWIGPAGANAELWITRVFAAPRKTVFSAWSEPRHFQRWFAPAGLTLPLKFMDFREGGKLDMTMILPDGTKFAGDGIYDAIVPMESITWTSRLRHVNPPLVVATTVTFADQEESTLVTVHQTYIDSGTPEGAREGWTSTLENLAALVAKLPVH